MKKAIPAIVAILLIVIIAGLYGFSVYKEKYAYSNERMDAEEYFGISSPEEIAVIDGDEEASYKARLIDGECYFDIDTVQTYFNKRFYYDENEQLIIYVEPLTINTVHIGESGYEAGGEHKDTPFVPAVNKDGTLYIACDFVKNFTNFEYTFFDDPNRIQLYTKWPQRDVAYIAKDTKIRYRGGVKSPILKDVEQGERVYVLEEMETWSEVRTDDGYIGYVEQKKLEGYETIDPIPVTDYKEPEFNHKLVDGKVSLAWVSIAGTGGNDTIEPLLAATKSVNVVSPTWFGLSDNSGSLSDFGSAAIVESLHNKGVQVWGLVSNFANEGIDTYAVLSSTSTRRNLISNIMGVVSAYSLDGVNVDFESLNVESGVHFVQFIRELSVECRKAGVILSVDNYVPIGNTDFYDRTEQGIYADYVVIMGYDEHYAGSEEAGSVASIGYVENGINKTIEEVEASRVINGLPFYDRIWETTGADVSSKAYGMAETKEWLSNHNIVTEWDDTTCQNYGEYTSGDTKHQVWVEDAESIKVKLSVMDSCGIGGAAYWRLGLETSDVWDEISEYINK